MLTRSVCVCVSVLGRGAVQLGIATEHGLAEHDQAIIDAENDLQRRTEEQAIVSRIAHDKFTAAKAKVDETAMELKRAQEVRV